jgi:hypothetical protein
MIEIISQLKKIATENAIVPNEQIISIKHKSANALAYIQSIVANHSDNPKEIAHNKLKELAAELETLFSLVREL